MAKTKTTADLIKRRNPLEHSNGAHITDRQLLALGGTSQAPDSATAPMMPIMKASDLRSRRADGHARNITTHARTEDAIRDSEARYRRLFEAAQDGILILDANTGLITDVNPFLMELLDYSREEFIGRALWQIGPFKDVAASKTAFRELQAQKYVRYENLPLATRAGRSINVEFVSNVYRVNNKKVIQCNVRDITRRKQNELTEQQLRQTQKMEAVGQLAGGVAHDFNNLLGVILGYCELLESRTDLAPKSRKMIEQIHNAGVSAKDLTRHLLAFSRRQVLQPVFVDLNSIVKHTGRMLGRLLGDHVALSNVLCHDLGTIKADPGQIEQVLMNLAVNARDAMPKGGKITFRTANVTIDEAYSRQHPYLKPGPYVMLSVGDTGVGMDDETRSRIFEPFFSTKVAGKGTGLGLSTVFGIVKQSAGAINVYSELGHGTKFKIYFPRCEAAPVDIQPAETAPLRGGSETLLLVDDAAPLRGLTRLLLEGCGYTVLDSNDPADALDIAARHNGPLPLLITDVVMPGFNGTILAERLRAVRPDMKVLYTSGYADDEVAQHGLVQTDCAFLEKPFTRNALIRKVREVLDSHPHN
ncbi:MAG TPA: ATP-binding protein [Candidatus Binatia bacterium]|nr:ATP-binding protein [Candidatus Binatia bacterium]